MTIQTTRWSPDTCSCVVEYSWDDTVPDSERVHSLSNVVNKCPAHNAQTNQNVYSSLLDENPRKNIALERVLANAPTALYDTVDGNRKLKDNIIFNFSFSGTAPNRVLTISFVGVSLTTQQKNTIQSALNTRFGSGKVLIV